MTHFSQHQERTQSAQEVQESGFRSCSTTCPFRTAVVPIEHSYSPLLKILVLFWNSVFSLIVRKKLRFVFCFSNSFPCNYHQFWIMDEDLQRKVIAFFEHAKFNGSKKPADREEQANFERPGWFDPHKFDLGVQTGRKYFFSIFTAHLSGLVILVYNQSILETLMSTGNSQTILALFKRYFNTAVHVKKWYDGDVFDRQDPAFSSICQARSFLSSNRSSDA